MKKLALAIAAVLASGVAFAETAATDISNLSSTADAPNNLYDFIDNDKLSGVAYGGAELGMNVLLGDQDGSIDHWDMFKVGADFTYAYSENLSFLIGGEARYAWGGVDTLDAQNYVDRFQFGIETVAGKTTWGKQCGIADVYLGFADISKEHGLGAEADEVACTEEQLNHHYFGNNFDIGAAYEHTTDAWALGGSYTVGPVVIGGTFVDIGKGEHSVAGVDHGESVYTLGAVVVLDKFNVAAKYAYGEAETGAETEEVAGYALGVAYQATTNLSLAATYNNEDYNDAYAAVMNMDSDDWFTLGASYRLNEHIELVTDYKVASEQDDKLFLRANVSL
ncbi:porin [Vibrio ulleungensis]|uniref:Porin n=1 Tax=Vibrio ulleungensis TaxID=2807619 RepID=A0ABS2HLC7_9VIBR|nr:porin [Vibrio ulleungensis]MBM7038285.1 porin [Vibrio ulleungensis]